MIVNDPILGQVEIPDPPEKVSLKDLWVQQQTLKVHMSGVRLKVRLHEWAIILIAGGLIFGRLMGLA